MSKQNIAFLSELEGVIQERIANPDESSYTARLFAEGPQRMAQKLGEEGVELALAGVSGDKTDIANEAADLVYHLLVLLNANKLSLADVCEVLERRHR